MARPRLGIEQHGGTRRRPLSVETHASRPGRPVPSGTFHAAGNISVRPGHSTPSGTGFLFPNAQGVPGREGMHPRAQDVPVETGRPGLVPGQCQASTGPVPGQALTQRPI